MLSGRSRPDRKSTRLNSSHLVISYAVFCLKKKKNPDARHPKREPTGLGGRGDLLLRAQGEYFTVADGHLFCCFSDGPLLYFFFFFNDTATTEIYTLSLHDALPI